MKLIRDLARGITALALALTLFGCASTRENRSTGELIDDTAIRAKVKTALLNDPLVKGMDVGVDVHRGEVQLSGWVTSAEEKRKATQIAEGVGGVRSVRNDLQIRK